MTFSSNLQTNQSTCLCRVQRFSNNYSSAVNYDKTIAIDIVKYDFELGYTFLYIEHWQLVYYYSNSISLTYYIIGQCSISVAYITS